MRLLMGVRMFNDVFLALTLCKTHVEGLLVFFCESESNLPLPNGGILDPSLRIIFAWICPVHYPACHLRKKE